MTATKNSSKKKSNKSGGGTLMSMRSGFKSAVGTGAKKKSGKKKWTFLQVFYLVAAVALAIALVYALAAR